MRRTRIKQSECRPPEYSPCTASVIWGKQFYNAPPAVSSRLESPCQPDYNGAGR
jgi:hypothetical protein